MNMKYPHQVNVKMTEDLFQELRRKSVMAAVIDPDDVLALAVLQIVVSVEQGYSLAILEKRKEDESDGTQ